MDSEIKNREDLIKEAIFYIMNMDDETLSVAIQEFLKGE